MESDDKNEVFDAEGFYAIPGLIDIHFYGCVSADVCDGSQTAIQKIADYEASVCVTSICPATMTVSKDELLQIMSVLGNYDGKSGSKLVGINMEGPFISRKKKVLRLRKMSSRVM